MRESRTNYKFIFLNEYDCKSNFLKKLKVDIFKLSSINFFSSTVELAQIFDNGEFIKGKSGLLGNNIDLKPQ